MGDLTLPRGDYSLNGLKIVSYHDLEGRPGFKLALNRFGDTWLLYMGHLWHRGWSIVDVTRPESPEIVRHIKGPPNTWTIQIQVAGGLMVTALEKIDPGWGDDPDSPFEEGIVIWDIETDPASPVPVGRYFTGGNGTHRNFFAGGPLLHVAAKPAGYRGHIYQIVDLTRPDVPHEVGRWWLHGQAPGEGVGDWVEGTSLHAPYVVDDKAYLAYGAAGLVILDIEEPAAPREITRLPFHPPFNPVIAVHTAVVVADRGMLIVNSEAIEENCQEPLNFAGLVDVSDVSSPTAEAMFPLPTPPPGAPSDYFCARGGRFGPHNVHQHQGHPDHLDRADLVFLTYFNAGLRVYDTTDPRAPFEVASFLPPDPMERRGPLPKTLVAQSEDVLVDARGYIYVTDKNHGLHVLSLDGLT